MSTAATGSSSMAQPYLSPTFQSSGLHTPLDVKRATISDPNYSRYMSAGPSRSKGPATTGGTEQSGSRHKWGRHYSYAGIGESDVHDFTQYDPYGRPFGIRGHDHWTTGALVLPNDVPVDDNYKVTDLKRSGQRPNDELVPRPLSVNLAKEQVLKPFPADHPFTSHTLQRDLFPSVEPPTEGILDEETGLPKQQAPVPPFRAHTTVRHKTRGSSARHEKLVLFERSEELEANKDRPVMHDIWDVDRTQRHKRALTYPAPQVLYSARPEQRSEMTVRPRTANALTNMKYKSFQTSTYQEQHAGRGPKHIDEIDDYEQKKTDKEFTDMFPEDRTSGPVDIQAWKPGKRLVGSAARGSSLKPASAVSRNTSVPPAQFGGDGYSTGYHVAKPREGRYSRTAAANLQVQDTSAVEEYGEMTADGRMRPGTSRCRSAGTVRFSNADPNKAAMGATRPNTPWVQRPGTGRYRYTASDEEGDNDSDGNNDDSDDDNQDTDRSASSSPPKDDGVPEGSSSQEQNTLWPAGTEPGPARQASACRYDDTNYADGWRPGTGVPRPRSTYHERQAAFKKTAVHDQMRRDFPEKPPDVRDNQNYPGSKRHTIHGTHSYWYHHG